MLLWLRVSQDIDFAGSWDPMIPDAEIISLLGTVLTKLDVGEFSIKVNVSVVPKSLKFDSCSAMS